MATSYGYGSDSGSVVSAKLLVSDSTSITENINGAYIPGLLLSGRYNSYTPAQNINTNGFYWSRTVYTEGRAWPLNIDTGDVYPVLGGIEQYYGVAVRCLLRES